MKNKEIKNNILYLLVSVVIFCINIFIIFPFADSNYAFSEGMFMPIKGRIILILISVPMLIAYLLYMLRIFKRLKYFNFLNYPLNILNLSLSFMVAFLSITGYGLFLMLLIIPLLCVIFYSLMLIFKGLIEDIKNWNEYIKSIKK